jgi:hypothetical protein
MPPLAAFFQPLSTCVGRFSFPLQLPAMLCRHGCRVNGGALQQHWPDSSGWNTRRHPSDTRSQNVHLKNLSFLEKPKIGIFACVFAQT